MSSGIILENDENKSGRLVISGVSVSDNVFWSDNNAGSMTSQPDCKSAMKYTQKV